jgi:hypothetical protein
MAGLFSKKTKKDKDDASSSNTSRHQGQPSSSSDFSQSPYPNQPHQPSVYSSKSSLQQQQHQGSVLSATSFSTHQSNAHGPWSSGMAMSTNPFPRFAHTAAYVTTGTDIFVHGGIVKGSAQKDLYVIDPRKSSFENECGLLRSLVVHTCDRLVGSHMRNYRKRCDPPTVTEMIEPTGGTRTN